MAAYQTGRNILHARYDNPWFASSDVAVTLDEIGLRDIPVLWDEIEEWGSEAGARFAPLRPHEGVFDDLTDLYADFDPRYTTRAAFAATRRRHQ